MKYIYSGNPKLVGWVMILFIASLSAGMWLWTHTDKPISAREDWNLEESKCQTSER